jgi:hypothetical protein
MNDASCMDVNQSPKMPSSRLQFAADTRDWVARLAYGPAFCRSMVVLAWAHNLTARQAE